MLIFPLLKFAFFANYLIEIVGQRNENFEQAFEVLWNALTLFLGLIILQQIEQNSFIKFPWPEVSSEKIDVKT